MNRTKQHFYEDINSITPNITIIVNIIIIIVVMGRVTSNVLLTKT